MFRPNILYLHCHDAGRYIQPYGHAVQTPHLQALAQEGVLFRQAFCAAPTCSPSRAALLTGQAPHTAGMLGLAHPPMNWRLHDYSQHLNYTLMAAGYTTVRAGEQHLLAASTGTDVGATLGYREELPLTVRQEEGIGHAAGDRARARATTEWLRTSAANAQPFFLDVGFVLPHRTYIPAEPAVFASEDSRYLRVPQTVPDTPATRADMAMYHASARVMDECCGRVLQALDTAGLAATTLVIATTDHGIAFPGMKCNLTDHGLGVYLIMRGPGGFDGGVVIDGMVSHSDIFPTICELLDLAPPEWLQGTSIMPLVRGEAPHVHEAIFGEVTYHAAYEPQRCIRTLRWKYIKRFDPHWRRPVLPNCDKSLSKQVRLDHGWALHEVPCVQLYDLVFDPGETRNLANDPSHADTCADLDARLTAWMTATGDPLLKGAVPLAEGCSIWPVDAESCEDSGSPGRTLYKER